MVAVPLLRSVGLETRRYGARSGLTSAMDIVAPSGGPSQLPDRQNRPLGRMTITGVRLPLLPNRQQPNNTQENR